MKKVQSYLVTAVILIVILFVLVMYFFSGLGSKDKCWDIGDQMAVGKPETIVIPADEAKKLFGKDIDISASGTAQVGTATYYHFKCHYDN
jgi:hypothetical protein